MCYVASRAGCVNNSYERRKVMKAIKSMTRLSCNDEKTLLKDINTDNYFFLTSKQLIPASEDEAKQFIKDICLPRYARLWPHDDFFSQFAK